MRFIYILIILLLLSGCKSSQEQPEFEQKAAEPDPFKRARQAADSGGGIFNSDRKNQDATVSFATSNALWRATLKSLNFLPLLNADYSGGIIITDWYSENLDSKESIKLTIKFLSNEIRSDSIEIIAHKKNCETFDKCQTTLLGKNFSQEIKDSIISNARILKIEDEKKKK
jgi:hypothetical protein